jgi:heme-degrading monooxygenase HmoA
MYGRLVEIDGLDSSRREEAMATMRERVIPSMKEAEGFAGFISLVDEQTGRARNVVLWETRESAEEFEREWATRREETVRGLGGTVGSAELYEALIVEIKAGARA